MASSEPVKHTSHNSIIDKFLSGVPARIMRPRLIFVVLAVAICMFGCLMVYSASSVSSLSEYGTATHYVQRQAIMMTIGWFIIAFIYFAPINFFNMHFENVIWLLSVVLLIGVMIAGESAGGATRWIRIAGFIFQPSEFVKIVIIMMGSRILAAYMKDEMSIIEAFFSAALLVGAPLGLILAEPDFGTTLIISLALAAMIFVSGIDLKQFAPFLPWVLILFVLLFFSQSYRLDRLDVALDPWADPYGDGYQATLAIMAFASGGLFGRGIGNSTMKYNYLPEAHNDFILAIIGEECGFFGTLLFIVAFLTMCWTAVRIARQCKDLHLRYFVMGCAALLVIQFFINAMGILSVAPMTGKTLPLISYGGSSVLATLCMIGLILRASRDSNEKTEADARRDNLGFVGANVVEMPVAREDFGVSEPMSRSERSSSQPTYAPRPSAPMRPRRTNSPAQTNPRSSYEQSRQGISNSGYGRINLGGGAQDRLRPTSGPVRRSDHHRNDSK